MGGASRRLAFLRVDDSCGVDGSGSGLGVEFAADGEGGIVGVVFEGECDGGWRRQGLRVGFDVGVEGVDVFYEGVEGHGGDISRRVCANEHGEDFDDACRWEGGAVGELCDAGGVIEECLDVVVEFAALVGGEAVVGWGRRSGSIFVDFVFEAVVYGPEIVGG